MDINRIHPSFFKFVGENASADVSRLRLRYHGKNEDFDIDFACVQIECRKKGRHKLPGFIAEGKTLFPSTLAYEQASHQGVAAFHASLSPQGSSVLDMTAGLGIDSMAFAEHAAKVMSCETDPLKADVLAYNASVRGLSNIRVANTDSLELLEGSDDHYDVIFADPARRGVGNSRVYNLHDCEPDITGCQDMILSRCDFLLVKASPLLDISQTLKDFPSTTAIRAISVGGECKEVLVEASKDGHLQLAEAIDLDDSGKINYRFSFNPSAENSRPVLSEISDIVPGNYLYEPGAPVMKLSPWSILTSRYPGLGKLSLSSHLFVSSELFSDFPGRILRINAILDKKGRKALKGVPANIVVRNYPLSAEELRKKLGVRDGGDLFIYASRIGSAPVVISASKIRI